VINFCNICFPIRQLLTYLKNVSRDSVMLQFRSGHCISHGCDKSSSLLLLCCSSGEELEPLYNTCILQLKHVCLLQHGSSTLQFRAGAGASLLHCNTTPSCCTLSCCSSGEGSEPLYYTCILQLQPARILQHDFFMLQF